jgi:hypothetical protein
MRGAGGVLVADPAMRELVAVQPESTSPSVAGSCSMRVCMFAFSMLRRQFLEKAS